MNVPLRLHATVLAGLLLCACAPNAAWRKLSVADCTQPQHKCMTEASTENHPGFDLSFVEFSERGNLFDQAVHNDVLKRIRGDAAAGVVVVVFVHGWKHNAAAEDSNVVSFRKALAALARSEVTSLGGASRKIHGVYVGWRGLSLHGAGLENLTYWDRKAAAEEIGKGGVTDLLLKLESLTGETQEEVNRNMLLIVGHSFGGALVLSALNEVMLERMNAEIRSSTPVTRSPAFGSGVILLNPAIEANHAFQLKEVSHYIGQSRTRGGRLLHVLSSEGDIATHRLFPIGQWFGVGITWNHETIERQYLKRPYRFREFELDTTTVGNLARFRTHYLSRTDSAGKDASNDEQVWEVSSRCQESASTPHDDKRSPIPCTKLDPISFVYTSPQFIKDHNDVFNPRVLAYVAATGSESLVVRGRRTFPECLDASGNFMFDACFKYHRQKFLAYRAQAAEKEALQEQTDRESKQ